MSAGLGPGACMGRAKRQRRPPCCARRALLAAAVTLTPQAHAAPLGKLTVDGLGPVFKQIVILPIGLDGNGGLVLLVSNGLRYRAGRAQGSGGQARAEPVGGGAGPARHDHYTRRQHQPLPRPRSTRANRTCLSLRAAGGSVPSWPSPPKVAAELPHLKGCRTSDAMARTFLDDSGACSASAAGTSPSAGPGRPIAQDELPRKAMPLKPTEGGATAAAGPAHVARKACSVAHQRGFTACQHRTARPPSRLTAVGAHRHHGR